MANILTKIYDFSLEQVLSERFSRYSKAIIQDRALPDVRDGLKPVQRRILYAMYKDKNTHDKPYRKSAKTVGNVMASFHPHGDSSIYEAMVRMSQYWKNNHPYIEMHGNNGSVDGDSPAAMRYTEARLSKISYEMLKDLEKDTVNFAPNYDDSLYEPTVLPARFPNLLLSGASGISAGYATNIPPHNLRELIEATILLIDNPQTPLEELIKRVPGPDFPTGSIIEDEGGIREAYETGRGKIFLRAATKIVDLKIKKQIIIDQLPYDVNKMLLVKKIDEIRIDKKIEGIQEIRDESDKNGLQIAIDIKKEASPEIILNYLFKNTDLRISYNFNMVAIEDRRPKTLGLIQILKAYINHQETIVTNRLNFELQNNQTRYHTLEGLIKAISILDEVIATIRQSKNKADAKQNLINNYDFSPLQAEAIVMLQLYRLTNSDIVEATNALNELEKEIKTITSILNDNKKLKELMKQELEEIKKTYEKERKTAIENEITAIKIETHKMIKEEDVRIMVTYDGYIKRTNVKQETTNGIKTNDYVVSDLKANTLDTMLFFTNHGNYIFLPIFEIKETKNKELGTHISNIVELKEGEKIVANILITDFENDQEILIVTKKAMIKKTSVADFKVQRYSKAMNCIALKNEDELLDAFISKNKYLIATNKDGYSLLIKEEMATSGIKSQGIKLMKTTSEIIALNNVVDLDTDQMIYLTNNNTVKRIKINEIPISNRATKGQRIIRIVKTNPYNIVKALTITEKEMINFIGIEESKEILSTHINLTDINSTGTRMTNFETKNLIVLKEKELNKEEEKEIQKKQISLIDIDSKIEDIEILLDKDFK
jgi:topoisomerase-4 subunit A